MKQKLIAVGVILCFIIAGMTNPALADGKHPADAEKLFCLINQRLSLMKEVAAFKWVNKKAIEDKAREAVVIRNASEAAGRDGLDVKSTKAFFTAQIEAAKQIQHGWHNQWENRGFPQGTKFTDLKTVIRPALIDLGNKIVKQIRKTLPVLHNPKNDQKLKESIHSTVTVEYVDGDAREDLLNALLQIKPVQ